MKNTVIDDIDALCAAARKRKAAVQAAGIRPLLANTGYSGADVDEPLTSAELDNREAPACDCGAPVYADGLCVAHHQEAFYARVRLLPAGEQFE